MSDLQHDTHYACDEALKEKKGCCGCTGHGCSPFKRINNLEKEQLKEKINELMLKVQPLKDRLNKIYAQEEKVIDERIEKAVNLGDGDFMPDELIFAAVARCGCGAGFAYPRKISFRGSWYCSRILLGKAEKGSAHDSAMPFAFYEVKSENQPSANGMTTRPKE